MGPARVEHQSGPPRIRRAEAVPLRRREGGRRGRILPPGLADPGPPAQSGLRPCVCGARDQRQSQTLASGQPPRYPRVGGGLMSTEHYQQAAILAAFVAKVREAGKDCGETLMQKAAYVMKELFGVPLGDEFRIH